MQRLRAKAHGNVEEFTLFVLPWLLCRKTFAERRDFVEMWIQRALEYPFQTTLVGLNRQAQAIQTESASTEELRTAMIRHRALFEDLAGVRAGQAALQRPAAATGQPAAQTGGRTRKIAIVPPKTADTPR